jgi:hypothetical protein
MIQTPIKYAIQQSNQRLVAHTFRKCDKRRNIRQSEVFKAATDRGTKTCGVVVESQQNALDKSKFD